MSISDRIKKLRKAVHLTQQEFADRIGSKRNTIATYEMGRTEPSAAVIALICREFNVNEAWLRTGKGGDGAMFVQRSRRDEIEKAVERLMSGETAQFKQRLVMALSSLDEKHWIVIEEKLREVVNGSAGQPAMPDLEAEARAEAEEYYRQRLLEKKAAAAASATSLEKDA